MTTTEPGTAPRTGPQHVAEELAGRLFDAGLGAFELATVQLGIRLGLYTALAGHGPATAAELAAAAGIDERYAREWCEQQTASGFLTVEPGTGRFTLPAGSEAVLLDPESPAFLAPIGAFLEAVGRIMPALEYAYRHGTGIAYADYGIQDAQAAFNRPAFAGQLAQDWLPVMPDLHERLLAGGTVAELGCGEGWAAIALARHYPGLRIDAFDADPLSVDAARRNAEGADVADRVRVRVADVADPSLTGRYDAVFAFEMLHDAARPVDVLRTGLRLTGGSGPVIVMDARVGDEFTAPAGPVERFLYCSSVLHCLPVGRVEEASAATGTVMRPETLRRYAAEAGVTSVVELPIEHLMFRFYRLEGSAS